jgi:hypothetical protein
MDYRANYDTAMTYLEAGLKDKGVEALCKIYNGMMDSGVIDDRETFLKLTAMMAKIAMENGKEGEAVRFIDEGLSVDQYDCDLLFLKAMVFWDQGRHDEMFAALVSYLLSLSLQDIQEKAYRYVNDLSISKVFGTLIPIAYRGSSTNDETGRIVRELAGKAPNPYLFRLVQVLDGLDGSRVQESG